MKHYMPTRILTGIGILQQNKDVFEKLGKKVLIITSPHAGKASGALDDLEAILKENGSSYDIF
ncbi:MAG: iron-containing alcohol dehydrogenase, partial [Erysipelotrichaceae bacterium]|nr:iron-containing alcohol dehydrogenase [Erysipelotrichaceae bacterium]